MSRPRASRVVSVIALLFVSVMASLYGQGQSQSQSQGGPNNPRATVAQAVRSRIARAGSARVIVELRIPGGPQPEATLAKNGGQQAVQGQRRNINAVRARALARIPANQRREIRQYETVPMIALEVGAAALAALESSADIFRIMPDTILKPTLESSVPRIEGDQAWQVGFDGSGTVVAILDTGVDAAHPFFGSKVVREACFSSFYGGMSEPLCPNGQTTQIGAGAAVPCELDNCFHGTHVAGIAAGNGAPMDLPFSGVGRGASLVAIQVFSSITDTAACGGAAPCLGAFQSDIIAALEYVYQLKVEGMNIASANMSLGGGAFDAPCDTDPMKPAIDNLRAAGIASIAAAGNSGEVMNIATPACISSAISVGATGWFDEVAWFSNVAPFLSLFAPGDEIVSALPGGDFEALSGTSMAAPHVAGAWAIFKQAVPAASVDEVLAALRNTGLPVTDDREGAPGTTIVPRVRIFKALSTLTEITNPVPTLEAVSPPTGRAGLPLTLTAIGTGFTAASVVRWNGIDVPTVADSITQITATVPAELMVLGTFQVVVSNPSPGGGVTDPLSVEVLPPPTLTVDQTSVGPSVDVTVTLTNGFGGAADWLAIAPAGSDDGTHLQSVYVGEGVLNRTWTVKSPVTSGQYEFRLFVEDTFQRVATSPPFTVDASISPVPVLTAMSPTSIVAGSAGVTLTLFGDAFVPSSSGAWNGSLRATTFVSSQQLQVTIPAADLTAAGSNSVTVVTPEPGGGTSSARTFTVIAAPELSVSSSNVMSGSSVTVTLTNGFGGNQDWLWFGLAGAADNAYLHFTYVGAGITNRTWAVTAPSTSGTYEFRLYREGSFVRVATSPTVTVQALPDPELTVNTSSVSAGQPITVTLTNGQGGNQDWLWFGATSAGDGGYLQFVYVGAGVTTRTWTVTAPAAAGSYEFRLFKQASFVRLATSPAVTVTGPPPPAPTLAVNVTTVAPGGSVTATLANGTGGATDLMVLAATGSSDSTYLQSTLVGTGVTSRQWAVTMPATLGNYEFRLLVNGVKVATSPVVQVQQLVPQLTVNVTSVAAGAAVTVTLTNGLGGNQDWLAFAPTGAPNNSYLQFVYVGAGVTTRTWTVNAPATAGTYEFRLFQNGTFARIATSPAVTVQAAPPPTLTVNTTTAVPGQSVTVTLTNGLGGATDWLALAPVGSSDPAYIRWTYVGNGVTNRTWTVPLPATPGAFEFRLYRLGSFVRLATSPAITSQSPEPEARR